MKKWMAVVLACMLLVLVTGCKEQAKTSLTEPSRSSDPILSLPTQPSVGRNDPTPVYVSVFGDTMILATYPVETWGVDQYGLPLKPECPVLACAAGGRLSCGESHELKTPHYEGDYPGTDCSGQHGGMVHGDGEPVADSGNREAGYAVCKEHEQYVRGVRLPAGIAGMVY